MILNLLVILAAARAQTYDLVTGPVPAEASTFKISIGNGEPFYGALRVEGRWVCDHGADISPTQVIECVPDVPFHTGESSRVLMRNVQLVYEPPAMRRNRLEEVWTSLGYTFLKTAAGFRVVRQEDIRLAQRARDMSQSTYAAQNPPSSLGLFPKESSALATGTRFSQGVLWLYRTGILSVSLVLVLLIYFFGRRQSNTWRRME